jgi:chitin deacetylase
MPQAWIDALNAAVTAGNIPNIPQSTESGGQNPVYPQGYDPTGTEVCSGTYKCMNPLDYWNAPSGYYGTGFDDGPTEVSFICASLAQFFDPTPTPLPGVPYAI